MRIHVAPISVNSMYYNDKRHGKTKAALTWSEEVLYGLKKYAPEIEKLTALFDSKKHVYTVHFIMNAPVDFYYNKAGEISARLIDVSNFEKPLLDLIFLPKFFGTNYPKQAINFNADDRYVRKLTSEKLPSDAWYFDMIVRIENKPTFVGSVKS